MRSPSAAHSLSDDRAHRRCPARMNAGALIQKLHWTRHATVVVLDLSTSGLAGSVAGIGPPMTARVPPQPDQTHQASPRKSRIAARTMRRPEACASPWHCDAPNHDRLASLWVKCSGASGCLHRIAPQAEPSAAIGQAVSVLHLGQGLIAERGSVTGTLRMPIASWSRASFTSRCGGGLLRRCPARPAEGRRVLARGPSPRT